MHLSWHYLASFVLFAKVSKRGRPFMGPNLYITPPGGFTHFHQDGHGTVDSGHFCMSGYNEVVILRRLTERHKKHALWILTRDRKSSKSGLDFYDGLYQLPHDDNLVSIPCNYLSENEHGFLISTVLLSFRYNITQIFTDYRQRIKGIKPSWPSKEAINECEAMGQVKFNCKPAYGSNWCKTDQPSTC
jgi:hypothetical protein